MAKTCLNADKNWNIIREKFWKVYINYEKREISTNKILDAPEEVWYYDIYHIILTS
jgi:hypothetical protein